MKENNFYKKNMITLVMLSCVIGSANGASEYPWDTRRLNDEIISHSTYTNMELYIDTEHKIDGVKLSDNTTLMMNGGGLAEGTMLDSNASIQMYLYDSKTQGNPVIQNTTANGSSEVVMRAGSSSLGQLFIGKDARLDIDSNHMQSTNVLVNTPAAAGNIYIENLTLAGTTNIRPTWVGNGEDGDAPIPEKPGPEFVTRIDNLTMQPGSHLGMVAYASGAQFNRLELKNLSGEGNFYLSTSLADSLSDKIVVSEHASGQFGIQVSDSGREITNPQDTQLVYINSGDARFNLINNGGIVEAGVWQYKLYNQTNDGHTKWYLVGGKPGELPAPSETNPQPGELPTPPETNPQPGELPAPPETNSQPSDNTVPPVTAAPQPVLSNSARAVINMATAPRHILETEISSLRQRMGDLRRNEGDVGVWARYLNDDSRLNDKAYSAFHINLNGMQIGADKKVEISNGNLLFGAFTSFSKSNIKSDNTSNGDIRSYSGGIYATWLDNSGFYMDTLLKMNRLSNEVRTNMNSGERVKADYNQNTVTASTEAGYSLPLVEAVKLTPYGKVAYSRIGKADYALDNGIEANVHAANSLQAEVGALLETEFKLADHSVRPYVKTAISREFIKNNDLKINNISFDSNYSGNVGKYGLGVTADVSKNASIYTEVNYQNGNKVETPVYATAGFRLSF